MAVVMGLVNIGDAVFGALNLPCTLTYPTTSNAVGLLRPAHTLLASLPRGH
jgi:hypothetical protein